MTAPLKEPATQIVRGIDGIIWKHSYHVCGFVLEIDERLVFEIEFGTITWDSALGLCQYFEEQKISFVQKEVIALRGGTGILSILTVLLGGNVTITDKPQLLTQIERNVSVNVPFSCRPRVNVCHLSWGYDHILFHSDYDFILAADIMYTHGSVPLIQKTLQHLSNEKTVIYFATTMSITPRLLSYGYQILSQHYDSDLVRRYVDNDVNVYRMTKKNILFEIASRRRSKCRFVV